MKELYWDYYNGYYYKDVKRDRNILTKEEKKLLNDMEKLKQKRKQSSIR